MKINKEKLKLLSQEAEQLSIDAFHAQSSLNSLYERAKRLQKNLASLEET